MCRITWKGLAFVDSVIVSCFESWSGRVPKGRTDVCREEGGGKWSFFLTLVACRCSKALRHCPPISRTSSHTRISDDHAHKPNTHSLLFPSLSASWHIVTIRNERPRASISRQGSQNSSIQRMREMIVGRTDGRTEERVFPTIAWSQKSYYLDPRVCGSREGEEEEKVRETMKEKEEEERNTARITFTPWYSSETERNYRWK